MSEGTIVVKDFSGTDIYTATLELRSVGSSKNLFPQVKFSHHFEKEPSFVPYSYRAVLQIAEAIGATVVEEDMPDIDEDVDVDEQIRLADAMLTDRDDDTIH